MTGVISYQEKRTPAHTPERFRSTFVYINAVPQLDSQLLTEVIGPNMRGEFGDMLYNARRQMEICI